MAEFAEAESGSSSVSPPAPASSASSSGIVTAGLGLQGDSEVISPLRHKIVQRENSVSSIYLKKDLNQLPLERSRLNVPFDDVLAGVSSVFTSASFSGGSVTGVSTTGCRCEIFAKMLHVM